MNDFFDYLSSKGIFEDSLPECIFKLESIEILDLILNGVGLPSINQTLERDSKFNFIANATLSGEAFPCSQLPCRIKNIDRLARNSILYADTVIIKNPLEKYYHLDGFSDYLRFRLAQDLAILYYAKPLFDEGIFQLSSPVTHVCKPCLKKMKTFSKSYEKKLEKVEYKLFETLLADLSFELKTPPTSKPFIEVSGPNDILEHPIDFILDDAYDKSFRNRILRKKSSILSNKDVVDSGIAEIFVDAIINDLISQNHYSHYYNAQYLTNRNLDSGLISQNQTKAEAKLGSMVARSLDHKLPFIQESDFSRLIKLRKEEGESFEIYRSSFSNFLKNIDANSYSIKEAFKDEIEPEINKINRTIKKAKKLIYADITKDVIVGSTFVSVGLLSNFLPSSLGQAVAAVGGINYLAKFGDNVKKLSTIESEAKENKYFFIWKLQGVK